MESQRRHLSTSQSKAENDAVPETTTTKSRSSSTSQITPAESSGHPRLVERRAPSPDTSTLSTPAPIQTQSQPLPPPTSSSHSHPTSSATTQTPQYAYTHTSSHEERRKDETPVHEPPVTKHTLSELDVSKIIHNPKLRHDINFDPELHFRPNLDGEKGRRKQQRASQFWDLLEKQLSAFVNHDTRMQFMAECGPGKDWCLPELLKAVKEIIQTLVPARDRLYLDEGLNVDLIMQQFYRGVADLEKLALWLSRVLKSHCAPMRDEWVDEMYRQLSAGNAEGDMRKLVQGMRSLLSVLEAMKLDVANHQIRCLRPVLIEDTVNFEQKFFLKKFNTGRVDRHIVRSWFKRAEIELGNTEQVRSTQQSFGDAAIFMNALSRLVLPSVPATTNLPNTFLFDEERIVKLRSDVHDAIGLEICMRMYEDLERLSRVTAMQTASDAIASSNFNFNAPPSRPNSGVFAASSRPGSGIFSSTSSTSSSSPRNSGGFFAQSVPSLADIKSKSAMVYSSLIALIQTAPHARTPSDRWAALAPEMALQIFRFTEAPQGMLSTIENKLTSQLTDFTNATFLEVEQQYSSRLLTELARRVKEFKGFSCLNLFTVATTRGGLSSSRLSWHEGRQVTRDDSGIEDIAIRLAHLGILHWRVWGPIAYIDDGSSDEQTEQTPMI